MAEPASAPLPRRQRIRAATTAELRAVARRLLVERGIEGVSLRAIGRELGMTAPAIYRYFDSLEQLLAAVAVDVYDELVAEVVAARDAPPGHDHPQRLIAASRAFRGWAVTHPREFGLVFANPMPSILRPPAGPVDAAGQRLGLAFAEVFAALLVEGALRVPADEEVDPALLRQLRRRPPPVAATMPAGAFVLFVEAWSRLYGAVCMEVFGHLSWAFDDPAPVFDATLRDVARLLGLTPEPPLIRGGTSAEPPAREPARTTRSRRT